MSRYYEEVEDGNGVTLVPLMDWAKGKRWQLRETLHGVDVSTVFLGLDHSFSDDLDSVPILYETLIFGGVHDQDGLRYATRAEAVAGHEYHKRRVEASMPFAESLEWKDSRA